MIKNPTFIKSIELKKLFDMPPTLRNCQCPEYDVCLNTAAIRCNPAIKGFYQRLIAAGKCHKVAATACMRKLLIIVNAMLRDQTLWQQN
jgi:hypothetical protein